MQLLRGVAKGDIALVRKSLERDEVILNRKRIPKRSRVRFKMLAGMEASMDETIVFFGSSGTGCCGG
jgi:hypothetical protein